MGWHENLLQIVIVAAQVILGVNKAQRQDIKKYCDEKETK